MALFLKNPSFWETPFSPLAWSLRPLATLLYALQKQRRLWTRPLSLNLPIICVGNALVGGAGKTPVTLSLVEHFLEQGKNVACLTRGYGGKLKGPVRVEKDLHTFRDVGDESLLLASRTTTYVARSRRAGALLAMREGADLLIMDDGFQNPSLLKTCSLLVVNSYGEGNGLLFPAGPLREPLQEALKRTDALILLEDDRGACHVSLPHARSIKARLSVTSSLSALKGRSLVAFAGLGHPEKFFATLRYHVGEPLRTLTFPDHHPYSPQDCQHLLKLGDKHCLVTTRKDWVRLPESMKLHVEVVDVAVTYDQPNHFFEWLHQACFPKDTPH